MKSNRYIIITSIFNPTEAVVKFAELQGYHLVVVGDKKSPPEYNAKGLVFLSVKDQKELSTELEKILPFNHYCRKNLGYIYAIRKGAEIIIDTDDDNIPYDAWNFPEFEGSFDTFPQDLGFVNLYKLFTDKHIWPRGFPLNKITSPAFPEENLKTEKKKIGIWQGLADEDPDVDAIYRLTNNEACYFNKRSPVLLSKGTICPFNSQNTAFQKELFPLLYLPSTVTFRFTDILRGLVAQPIMWNYNYCLGFTEATVRQERNFHNYMKDFESEIPCYLESERVIGIVEKNILSGAGVSENLFIAYKALHDEKIVEKEELAMIEAWIEDIK